MGEFPDGYPADLLDRILKEKGGFVPHQVYRVAPYGLENKDSYLSSYQEDVYGLVCRPTPLDLNKISTYSTSCSQSIEDMKVFLKVCLRKRLQPKAEIIYGTTNPDCGPSRLNKKTKHVDWWIFRDTTPWIYFTRMEV